MRECRGSVDKLELVNNTAHGLKYLKEQQDSYFILPRNTTPKSNKTKGLPRGTPSANENKSALLPADTIFQYHTYWHGKWTWRVELFIKGFLFTQNLSVSHLTIWLDTNFDKDIVSKVTKDPRVQQFRTLMDKGIISFKAWSMPTTISLPDGMDHTDGYGFVDNADRRGAFQDSEVIADSVQRDPSGKVFMRTDIWGIASEKDVPARSDIFRFIILHEYGGLYLDMDMLLLRDMHPLLLSGQPFAERWGNLHGHGDYNTAILAMSANSELSSFCIRAGVRQRMFFHPRAIGMALFKDGRQEELALLESAAFDPIWPEFAGTRSGEAPSPACVGLHEFFEAKSGPQEVEKDSHGVVDPRVKQFYAGSFAYHIHNQVSCPPLEFVDMAQPRGALYFARFLMQKSC